jgi:outer membrane immunogenic protein
MKKITLSLLALAFSSLYCNDIAQAGTMGPIIEPVNNWGGFYIGANAGYWWAQNNAIRTEGNISFVNPVPTLGPINIANALATVGTHRISDNLNGFIGGGQLGYNYLAGEGVIVGIDADIAGLSNSARSTRVNKTVFLDNFPEAYSSIVHFKKKIDYLGTVRGRFGFLAYPNVMFYAMGGFAYGGVSLEESFVANESLGPLVYPTVAAGQKISQTRTGWTAGGGVEWMFNPQWTAKLEYTYYDLGSINNNDIFLGQVNTAIVPSQLWGAANVCTSTRFTIGTVRVGLNYYFT